MAAEPGTQRLSSQVNGEIPACAGTTGEFGATTPATTKRYLVFLIRSILS